MKVLLIDVNCKYSSTGKLVYDLYTNLNNHGHTAAIAYGRGALVKEPMIYKFSSNLEVYAHAFLTRVTGLTGVYSPVATNRLIRFIEDFKPDVVHIHELHAYFINIAPLINYLKKNKIRTVWTFHCEFMYTGKCGHAYECEKWKDECGDCPQIAEYPASLFFDFTKRMFKEKKKLFLSFNNLTIVTPSKWLANRVKQSFLKNKDIRVIHNGIDTTNIFYPRNFRHLQKRHKISNEKIVLAVAPDLMSEQKGGKWILELAKKLKNENIKFILIGINDINQKYDHNIIPLGRITNQIELAEYYSMADLTVLTSKKETFSLVCAESISCGTPVVGFNSGAPSEIAPHRFGIFVSYGDIDLLTTKVRSILWGNNNLASADECSEFGNGNYNKEIMEGKYLDIY